jgi:hypothetical protein
MLVESCPLGREPSTGCGNGLKAFPFFAGDIRFTQQTREQVRADVPSMGVGQNQSDIASLHKLIPAAGEWTIEAKLP